MSLSVLLYVVTISPVLACGNFETQEPINFHHDEMTLTDGTNYTVLSNDKVPFGQSFSEEEKKRFKNAVGKMDSLYQKTKNIDYLSDKGLLLMYLGQYEQAEKIYLNIEKIAPNRYSTASNLGTTYELMGKNQDALKWITKGVALNPNSHKDSEWIHVNILKAKVKGEAFHTAKEILGVDFGNEKLPTTQLSRRDLSKLHDQLLYQLNERVHFVKPENKVVAELTYALANTAFLLEKYSGASYNYEIAKEYGYNGKWLDERFVESTKLAQARYSKKQNMQDTALVIGVVAGLLVFFALFVWGLIKLIKRIRGSHEELNS